MKNFFLILIVFFMSSVIVQAADNISLPVKHVILSTSGVANFEHQGEVTDDVKISLAVQFDQVDDLLKSLMVFDSSGQLGGISLPGRTPLSQVFRDLPFSQHQLDSPIALINALQGAPVTVLGPSQISGKIVRVVPENIVLDDDKQKIKQHRLTLLDENGFKQTVLEDLNAIHFDDAKLQMQINQALEAIHTNAARESRTLTIDLQGKGVRDVSVSYVVATPIWKAAYRLMVPTTDQKNSFVQGWAIIENMTGQDWKDVVLTLVSGNPVTYRQLLYQPYYIERPAAPVEVPGRILPRPDTGVLGMASGMETDQTIEEHQDVQYSGFGRRLARSPAKAEQAALSSQVEEIAASEFLDNVMSVPVASDSNVAQILTAVGEEATTQVLFRFPGTFDLAAGHSLMVPFVSRELPVEHLWLYQPETHVTHPLATLRVKNDGDTGLPPGIVTLYDKHIDNGVNQFVGDAKLPSLSKGEDRLVSYALDTKTLIDKEDENITRQEIVAISDGVMKTNTKYLASTKYTVKAPKEEERVVILEHQRLPQYKLVQPAPEDVEETKTHYRIRMLVKAGERKVTNIILERSGKQSIRIMDLSYQQLHTYTSATNLLSPQTRELFQKLAEVRQTVNKIDAKIRQLDDDRQSIFNDQQRIRENLRAVPNNSDIGQRYLDSLNNQENKLEQMIARQTELEVKKNKLLSKLKDIIAAIRL